MERVTYPALDLRIKGWLSDEHKITHAKGWFNQTELHIYIGFVKGHGKEIFEKWIFRESSFIEDIAGGLPSISVDENDIISKTEISEDEFNTL